ncbi:MAG: (2Fe-2S)-binding protein [Deltaproteobacteria bacterium]|jgi:carbon-monoxide dehydrogenase small subunit|nr:(2Fe-2S)-binding protein [Deltaproteobacteria bacterium]MBW2530823.1 (2Fe-2S)-binding protein [Deltaproteobacteria bacterium]
MNIELTLNGEPTRIESPPLRRLIDVLRGPLRLTGTKEGCGEGECGSCTVLLDGEAVNACLVPIGQCHGRSVTTVEGLATADHLTLLQQSLNDHGGAQCGICTPGVLMAAEALLHHNAAPSEDDVRTALAGNICRCTGYERIVRGVLAAAKLRQAEAREQEVAR